MQVDTEIKHKNDDMLNWDEFASRLAKIIIEYKPENALTIGIMGSWGSGKSSLIKLTENHLEKENIIILHFNPWYFSNQDNLYLQFFKLIISSLRSKEINEGIFESKIKPKRNMFKKQDTSLENYFNYLKDNSLEFNICNLKHTSSLESYDSLQYHKKQCKSYIDSFRCKIIVIIDDIDRMANPEIAQIFTLVKSLADFDHFIYILSFDKLIVSQALKNINSDYTNDFIDKIINVPIIIPKISESKINELILSNIEPIYSNQIKNNSLNQFNEFYGISKFLKLFIKDIRGLKRYMNMLEFHITYFDEELNVDDFLLILAIQLFEYELFTKISENQELLTINVDLFKDRKIVMEIITENYEKFIDEIGIYWNKYENLLTFLFPLLNVENMPVTHHTYEKWIKEHKICSEEYFEKYFTLSLETREASDLLVERLIKMDNEDEIYHAFTKRNKPDYNSSLLHKFSDNINEIPNPNGEYFIKALMKCGDKLEIYHSSRTYISHIIIELFKRTEEKSQYELLKECIRYPNNVLTASEFVYNIISYKLMDDNIKNIKHMVIAKIHECSRYKDFLNMKFLQDMLYYWRQIESIDTVKQYVFDNVKTDDEKLSFLSKFRTKRESPFYIIGGGSDTNLVLDLEELSKYHELEVYEEAIKNKLNETNISEDIAELCEIFLKQYEEYKINKFITGK